MRKYRNIKFNLQPRRILKYSEEYLQYRQSRGALSVKAELCDTDADGFEDAIVRDWRSPALKKLQTCGVALPEFGPTNLRTTPSFGPTNLRTTPSSGPTNLREEIPQAPGDVTTLTALPDAPGEVSALELLSAPSEVSDFTANPDTAGQVTGLTATPEVQEFDPGTELSSNSLHGTHAAMNVSGTLDHNIGPRFKDSSGNAVTSAGGRVKTWTIEYAGWNNAPFGSDDDLGGTLVGQDGSWGVELDSTNFESFAIAGSGNRASITQDDFPETHIMVLSIPTVGGSYRWGSLPTGFELPVFGTFEPSGNPKEFGAKLTLTNNAQDLTFSIKDNTDTYQSTTVANFAGGIGSTVDRFMVTLTIGKNNEDSILSVDGGSQEQTFSIAGLASFITNQQVLNMDSYVYGGSALAGSVLDPKREMFTDMVIHEVAIMQAPTADGIDKMEGHLAHKWSIAGSLPSNHTYKNNQP